MGRMILHRNLMPNLYQKRKFDNYIGPKKTCKAKFFLQNTHGHFSTRCLLSKFKTVKNWVPFIASNFLCKLGQFVWYTWNSFTNFVSNESNLQLQIHSDKMYSNDVDGRTHIVENSVKSPLHVVYVSERSRIRVHCTLYIIMWNENSFQLSIYSFKQSGKPEKFE